ncbi:MAG TPA: hypothetical protein VJ001_02180, partial [Rhodocyclaceae bacterium]|nr:hypothetical protein [Rhodocyclaceae bacterium]
PMDAIALLAEAVGAIIVPARNENAFAIAYRHTIPSWQWATTTTTLELGDDLCWRLSGRFNPATQHNKIYVIGSTVGVGATRQGTAGDTPAQTIVDALLTDANAATERARQALSASGHRLELSLECPLTPAAQAPGLIEPGRLVRLGDFSHAMTTGVSISANWSEDSGLQIHQTVTLERAQ